MQMFKKVHYTLYNKKIKEGLDGCRFVFLSDLHNCVYGNGNRILMKAIREIKPDGILVGGDMMVAKGQRDISVPVELLTQLSKDYLIFAGNGNHELRMKCNPQVYGRLYEDYVDKLTSCGIIMLENESAVFERRQEILKIYGLDIPAKYFRKLRKYPMGSSFIANAVGESPKKEFSILLAHNPGYFNEYAGWGADISLSGHYHGGTIRLPGIGGVMTPDFELFPRYDTGLFYNGSKAMIVSSGLGTHSINLRINNPPQLVVITLRKHPPGDPESHAANN